MIRKTSWQWQLCLTLLSLTLAFIWGNSLLPGNISDALSDAVKDLASKMFPFLFQGSDGSSSGLLRKIAHFSEFAVLGICLSWLFGMLRSRQAEQILLTLVCGILAACIDETIQRFVPGRHASIADIGIDSAGIIAGILLFTIGYLIYNTNQIHLEESK